MSVDCDSHRALWAELGMNLELHDRLLENMGRNFARTHQWQCDRPVMQR